MQVNGWAERCGQSAQAGFRRAVRVAHDCRDHLGRVQEVFEKDAALARRFQVIKVEEPAELRLRDAAGHGTPDGKALWGACWTRRFRRRMRLSARYVGRAAAAGQGCERAGHRVCQGGLGPERHAGAHEEFHNTWSAWMRRRRRCCARWPRGHAMTTGSIELRLTREALEATLEGRRGALGAGAATGARHPGCCAIAGAPGGWPVDGRGGADDANGCCCPRVGPRRRRMEG